MTNVIFIELPVPNKARYISQISEKYYGAGKRVLIYVENENEGRVLEKMLWTWKEDSFIPHVFTNNPDSFPDDPVLVTNHIQSDASFDTLILNDPLPTDRFDKFENVLDFAEIYDNAKRQESRERFKVINNTAGLNLSFSKLGSFLHQNID